jgi:hypothetical protein
LLAPPPALNETPEGNVVFVHVQVGGAVAVGTGKAVSVTELLLTKLAGFGESETPVNPVVPMLIVRVAGVLPEAIAVTISVPVLFPKTAVTSPVAGLIVAPVLLVMLQTTAPGAIAAIFAGVFGTGFMACICRVPGIVGMLLMAPIP